MEQIQIDKELKILENGSKFISKNFKSFSENYLQQFIAVRDNKLLAVEKTFREVMLKLKEMKINPSSVIVTYIPTEEEILAI